MTIAQIFIFIFGVSAIWLVGRKEDWRRYGFILGLCGQPFWFYTAYMNEQWGVLLMCLFYTYSWGSGVYTHWIKKQKQWTAKEILEYFKNTPVYIEK